MVASHIPLEGGLVTWGLPVAKGLRRAGGRALPQRVCVRAAVCRGGGKGMLSATDWDTNNNDNNTGIIIITVLHFRITNIIFTGGSGLLNCLLQKTMRKCGTLPIRLDGLGIGSIPLT